MNREPYYDLTIKFYTEDDNTKKYLESYNGGRLDLHMRDAVRKIMRELDLQHYRISSGMRIANE